jgi:hypothetical protein
VEFDDVYSDRYKVIMEERLILYEMIVLDIARRKFI